MYRKPLLSQEIYYTERAVYEHERKKEYRQDDHMQNLWYETSESLGNCCHILSLF